MGEMSLHIGQADVVIALGCRAPHRSTSIYAELETAEEVAAFAADHFRHNNQRVAMVVAEDFPAEEKAKAIEEMEKRQAIARVNQNTVSHKTVLQVRNYLTNLDRLRYTPLASDCGEPLKGYPCFIVGAGPSLDKNRHLLKEAQKRGAVFAVNTSAKALDFTPDATFVLEGYDISHNITHRGMHVVDMTAHPNNWTDNSLASFHLDAPTYTDSLSLGAVPAGHGAGVASMAYSYAVLWGASPIVLAGMDLSWPGGKCYSDATDYAGQKQETADGTTTFTGPKQVPPLHAVEVEAYGGGGKVNTGFGMDSFIQWFGRAARDFITINATEGGARIPNTMERPLSYVFDIFPERDRPPVPTPQPTADVTKYKESLRLRAEAVLDGAGVHTLPLLNMWLVPENVAIREQGKMLPAEIMDRVDKCIKAAAQEILEAL